MSRGVWCHVVSRHMMSRGVTWWARGAWCHLMSRGGHVVSRGIHSGLFRVTHACRRWGRLGIGDRIRRRRRWRRRGSSLRSALLCSALLFSALLCSPLISRCVKNKTCDFLLRVYVRVLIFLIPPLYIRMHVCLSSTPPLFTFVCVCLLSKSSSLPSRAFLLSYFGCVEQ